MAHRPPDRRRREKRYAVRPSHTTTERLRPPRWWPSAAVETGSARHCRQRSHRRSAEYHSASRGPPSSDDTDASRPDSSQKRSAVPAAESARRPGQAPENREITQDYFLTSLEEEKYKERGWLAEIERINLRLAKWMGDRRRPLKDYCGWTWVASASGVGFWCRCTSICG